MSINDREFDYPQPEDFGLTICPECEGYESAGNCLCLGEGWLLDGKPSNKSDINNRFHIVQLERLEVNNGRSRNQNW